MKKILKWGAIGLVLFFIFVTMVGFMTSDSETTLVNPSDEMAEQWEKNDEISRREIEIKELKRSNKIARITTIIAVLALLISTIFGGVQVWLDWVSYQDQKNNSTQEINLVTPEE